MPQLSCTGPGTTLSFIVIDLLLDLIRPAQPQTRVSGAWYPILCRGRAGVPLGQGQTEADKTFLLPFGLGCAILKNTESEHAGIVHR